jgi:hypothetical protein
MQVKQPWYADNAGAGGNFQSIRYFLQRLQEIGPDFGYFLELTKSIIIVHEHNLKVVRTAFADLKFKVNTGNQYLGGFIGEEDALRSWLKEKTTLWTEAIHKISLATKNFPQSPYAGLQKSLQQEWQFVQRVVKDICGSFIGLEEALSKAFLPSLFHDAFDDDDPCRKLATLHVKFAGLAIPNSVISSNPNYKASTLMCSHIIAAICGMATFGSLEHKEVIRDVKAVLTTCNNAKHETALNLLSSKLSCNNRRTIL